MIEIISSLLPLIEKNGFFLVATLILAFLYIQSNKNQVKVSIEYADKQSEQTAKFLEQYFTFKDEIKTELGKLSDDVEKVNNTVQQINLILTIKRSDGQ